jgi:poly(3-hydroxybutyrate) depolymerase
MKKLALLLLLAISTFASAAAKAEKQTLTSAGKERIYYTFVPEKLTAPTPLLLLLHGSGRDGMSQINEWKDLAAKEGLILAAPDSANSREWSMNTDGPEFLHEVVEAVRAKNSVDGKRIYIFGHSAGAVFALYMAVMESKYFAAAGVHAGAMGEDFYPYLDLAQRKVPITIWVGTDDPYFSLALVKGTQGELNKHGFQAQVVEMKGHDHNYYAVSKDLNPKILEFFRSNKLEADAAWQIYQKR